MLLLLVVVVVLVVIVVIVVVVVARGESAFFFIPFYEGGNYVQFFPARCCKVLYWTVLVPNRCGSRAPP